MNTFLTARMKHSPEEFFAIFQSGDEHELFNGRSLLLYALGNGDAHTRYTIAEFLIGRDCLIGPPGPQGHTSLHVLFSHYDRDLSRDLEIARWLIDHGVDVNARDYRGTVAFCELLINGGADEELSDLYDLLLSQPNLDLTTPNVFGYTPIDLAECRPHRATLTARMKEYVHDHPHA